MTVYISPNPGKISASEVALRAAQILQNHGASVLMCEDLRTVCNAAGVVYLPLEQCLERADVILTIGGDGTILHEANLSLKHAKPILGINLGRCGFLATCEVSEMESKLPAVARGEFQLDNRMLLYAHVLGHDGTPLAQDLQELHTTTRLVHSYALGIASGIPGAGEIVELAAGGAA